MLDLDSLNKSQREAVTHGSGPLLVLAGPGSGKTFTITQRIFYLIEKENVPPEKILVITFTKDAASAMQNRFIKLSDAVLPVNFGTFHSVFYHILRESHILKSNQILTESQKRNLIIPIIRKHISKEELQRRQESLAEDAGSILSGISYYKNTGEQERAAGRLSGEIKPYFQPIMEEYERERYRRGGIDFDDMVYECRRLLSRDEGLRKYWQKRFTNILIDEFQDINPVQYEVIRLLADEPYSLFAVGDDDQSVYGFRGSKPECLRRFAEDFNAKQICLNINYRSRKEIIRASGAVIEENKNRFPKQLEVSPDKEGLRYEAADTVKIYAFTEREQQYAYLLSHLRESDGEKSIGVLFRTNAYMQGFAAILSREGIPYTMKEKAMSIYEHFIVKDIMAYIALAQGRGNRALFLQIMNKPSRYISREALGEGIPEYREIIRYYRRGTQSAYQAKVIQAVERWEKQMQSVKELSPFLAVQYIRKVIGYENYLKERAGVGTDKWQEWEEILTWLGQDAAGYERMSDWMTAQETYTKSLKTKKDQPQDKQSAISLMTVHASKGLEFDRVYIPDCNEKVFPHGKMPDPEACEEERRIFYVAMTRAKENLELLYLTGTKDRPRLPSRFLNKLFRDYSSTNSSNSQLSKYSSNASAIFSYSSSSSI